MGAHFGNRVPFDADLRVRDAFRADDLAGDDHGLLSQAQRWLSVGVLICDSKRLSIRCRSPATNPDDFEVLTHEAFAPCIPRPAFVRFAQKCVCCVAGRGDADAEAGKKLDDPRLGPQRTLSDSYHPWTPATTKADWEKQSQAIRERILVATGLWPMPPKEPLKPVIHGRIDRGDYTVEKLFFASMPGHYVSAISIGPRKSTARFRASCVRTGTGKTAVSTTRGTKRPSRKSGRGPRRRWPAPLPAAGPHGWAARLGCVVFHYDMVGDADSQPIKHASGFADAEAELRLESAMGLQTWNSIRALDFITSLPEVDPKRIGVTGASGGGTQTFILWRIDPRPAVAFPAVMVSTNMQGGCVCETADLLRIGINNVAIAALFAPKPLGMSGAHDWTIDLEHKGLPELKQVYSLYGRADDVYAKVFPQFGHDYNRVRGN